MIITMVRYFLPILAVLPGKRGSAGTGTFVQSKFFRDLYLGPFTTTSLDVKLLSQSGERPISGLSQVKITTVLRNA